MSETLDARSATSAEARHRLVTELTDSGAIRSGRIRHAMSEVAREDFLPPTVSIADAYSDKAVTLATGQDGFPTSTASQPTVIAEMLEQLSLRPGHRVLEIGAASGYNTALLSHLAAPGGEVHSIEIDPDLAATASTRLRTAAPQVTVHAGDGWHGIETAAPFDRIISTVGLYDLSPHWLDQLHDDGILVAPLWLRPGIELSVAFRKTGGELHSQSVFPCSFLRLRGRHTGPDSYRKIDDTRFVTCEAFPDHYVDALRELLTTTPVTDTPAPSLPPHWFTGFALREPRAIQLFSLADPAAVAHGLFDPEHHSLVLIQQDRLLSYGNPDATQLLRTTLDTSVPVDPRALTVHAIPNTIPPDATATTITRQHFTYRLDTV